MARIDVEILKILGIDPEKVTRFKIGFSANEQPYLYLERAITDQELGEIKNELYLLRAVKNE
jgi:hypothetical protein